MPTRRGQVDRRNLGVCGEESAVCLGATPAGVEPTSAEQASHVHVIPVDCKGVELFVRALERDIYVWTRLVRLGDSQAAQRVDEA